jgi:ABC-type tungstate transport system substrate-binding protein
VLETGQGHFALALLLGAALLSVALVINLAIVRYQRRVAP